MQLRHILTFLEAFAPSQLAEEWDNVGLLVGDPSKEIERIMTCLTVTPASAAEAIRERVNLIVTHHPLPFKPLKRLTTESTPGRLLLSLIRAGVAIHSPHTAFDSALAGINQRLAEGLGLSNIQPLIAASDGSALGSGRFGQLPDPLALTAIANKLKQFLKIDLLQAVGSPSQMIERSGVACGSAGSFLDPADRAGCQLLVTGETTFHTCLEAEAQDIALLLPGHYASERFAVEGLAEILSAQFQAIEVFASREERDPLVTL